MGTVTIESPKIEMLSCLCGDDPKILSTSNPFLFFAECPTCQTIIAGFDEIDAVIKWNNKVLSAGSKLMKAMFQVKFEKDEIIYG